MLRNARRYRWMRLPIAILLCSMLLPVTTPAAAQTSDDPPDSLCTGDPQADYYGPCGPSLSIPDWSDVKGWDNGYSAVTIELVDLNGDGRDELVGNGPNGVEVYSFNSQISQWMPAFDPTKPLPFPNPVEGTIAYDSIRYGQLADGVWGVIGLAGSGLETWSWNLGDGSLSSGYWTLENQNGPFAGFDLSPGYWETIQFVRGQLEGLGYSIIGRYSDGMHACGWDHGSKQWNCVHAGDAFNDSVMTLPGYQPSDGPTWEYLADYFYVTVQTIDLYQETAGPELVGLDNTAARNLRVYAWDAGSKQFTLMQISGNAPFWSPQGQWFDMKYSSTIQPVQLLGEGQPSQIMGRSKQGLEWHSVNTSGCGGHTPPCWKNLSNYTGNPLSDGNGYGEEQYYATMRFADLDGDGIDELIARAPGGTVLSWGLHQNAGWYALPTFRLQFTGGPADDPLWSDFDSFNTIQAGDITGDGRIYLTARGKYGIRTFGYWDKVGWGRPLPYGFPKFSSAEQNAYNLANAFVGLDPTSGTTIRTQYSANVASTLLQYQDCFANSLNAPMPPSQVCATEGGGSLSNPNNVTSEQWESMVKQLQAELHAAHGLTEYSANSNSLITDVFFYSEAGFNNAMTQLFPSPPSPSHSILASLFNLFIAVGEAGAIVVGPEAAVANASLHLLSAAVGAMQMMQTPRNSANTRQLKVEEAQGYIYNTTAHTLSRQTDLYQYIAADSGLLALYGQMTNEGFWDLTGSRSDAATSAAVFRTSTWIYQTFTPVFWQIWVCQNYEESGVANSCEDFSSIDVGTNAAYLDSDQDWIALLGDGDKNAITASGGSGKLFQRVFNANPDGACIVGGDDGNTNWTTSCNLGADINSVLYFGAGWTSYSCTVFTLPIGTFGRTHACGDGPPDNYGPPG